MNLGFLIVLLLALWLCWYGLGSLYRMRSRKSRMLVNAENWIEVAERAWHYRRDQLDESERKDLLARTEALRKARRERAEPEKIKLQIEALDATLRQAGGRIYRRGSLVENVEFLLVAAIVILGVRTYFVQPFKIPTNSMWPSYYGMTPQVYPDPDQTPGRLEQAFRFLALGADYHEIVAPADGPISVAVDTRTGRLFWEPQSGRRWLILPGSFREYVFYVNDVAVRERVPLDFDFDAAFLEAFELTPTQLMTAVRNSPRANGPLRFVTLARRAEAGKAFLSFDVLTGDQLFVDRVSYHFARPAVGQGFVFRTGNIPGIAIEYGDQYYIKRLVGLPGDRIEIRDPALYRNGSPIQGSPAFDRNARRDGLYRGYLPGPENGGLLREGEEAIVPDDHFFALGDNSSNSADGRYWGYVPAADVVGKPLFIYFPFTSRWGRTP